MQKMTNKINVLSESLVYDYVAGNMSDKPRKDFEEALLSDPDLRDAVEAEKRLRITLLDMEDRQTQSSEVNAGNFNALLEALDDEHDTDLIEPARDVQPNWYAGIGIAASVVFAMVLFMSFSNDKASDFTLLSDDAASNEIDFNSLVRQQKVAQVWLNNDLSSEQLSTLFTKYKLKPIGRAGRAWIVVSLPQLTADRIAKLASVESVGKISLISYEAPAAVIK